MSLTKSQKEILAAWPGGDTGLLDGNRLAKLPVVGARSLNETANIIDRLTTAGYVKRTGTNSQLANGRLFENAVLTIEGSIAYWKLKGVKA